MDTRRLLGCFRYIIVVVVVSFGMLTIVASAPTNRQARFSPTPTATYTTYKADYQISLTKVERPEKAGNRYGPQKVYSISADQKYRCYPRIRMDPPERSLWTHPEVA